MKVFFSFLVLTVIGYLVFSNYNVGIDIDVERRAVQRGLSDFIPDISLDDLIGTDTANVPVIVDPTTKGFYDALGERESGGDYKAINQYGYMGKYQFHSKTLKWLKIDTDKTTYLNSPALQEESVRLLVIANKKLLSKEIVKFDKKYITYQGKLHPISESGILAGAHLAGHVNVKNFLNSGIEFRDGNGVHVAEYIIEFSFYTI